MMLNMNQAKERRQKEFETALKELRGEDADVSQEAAEIQVVLPYLKCKLLFQYYIDAKTFSTGLYNNP